MLAARPYTSEMERKLASVLFVDLVGSTALVSGADPEVVRRRVNQFFDRVSHCVATHGGTVEKFAGDAVLAVFGVPQAHEDDAERAVRAGLAIVDEVAQLGLQARAGVESGEVVVEDAESTFVTGEAVNLAARLQQSAPSGELLIGPGARGLTLGRIEAEDVGLLQVKGREEPLSAWRAVCAVAGEPRAAVLGAPLIGREAELELLENTYARTVRDARAHLFTIYGEPGVGKSRLAREFLDSLEGATVLQGRCLPYGEGITYWPLAEMVKAAAGISDDDPLDEAFEKLRACCEEEAVADLLGLASGLLEALEGDASQNEIAWAAREWATKLAEPQPLVLLFEDIHWAEEPLLDLVEHLASRVRAPLLILCLARPELLDVHPGWGGGRVRATAIELEPLPAEESELLLDALLADEAASLTREARRRLLEKTEGNPLFVEETIRMLLERDGDRAVEGIPDTLQALIAARIDRLPPVEKRLLQRAAVIGRVFWVGALARLSPDVEDVETALEELQQRDLVLRERRSSISGESAHRFKHVLIREVAYAGLSKSARADLHAGFARWLEERVGEELLEIRAYHLDQAVALLEELDGAAPGELVSETAAALHAAGKRALAREANRAARKLLARAAELEPTLRNRYHAAVPAWRMADFPTVSAEMQRVANDAKADGDTRIHGLALTALAQVALLRDADLPRARELAEEALEVLDGEARFDTLTTRADVAWWVGDMDGSERYLEEALEVARESGRKHLESVAMHELARVYRSRLELDRFEQLVERGVELAEESGSIVARAAAFFSRGDLHVLRGELEQAEASFEQARALFAEAGSAWMHGRVLVSLARVVARREDLARAERLLRDSIRILKPLEDRGTLCESERSLAEVLVRQGKLDEAERYALEARETVGPHDVGSTATTTMTLGMVRAAQGREGEAEQLLREAKAAIEATAGCKDLEIEALETLVQFLRERGREADAEPFARRLLELAPARTLGDAFVSNAARIA